MLLKPKLIGGVVVQCQTLPETQNSGFGRAYSGFRARIQCQNWGFDFEILRFRVQCPN